MRNAAFFHPALNNSLEDFSIVTSNNSYFVMPFSFSSIFFFNILDQIRYLPIICILNIRLPNDLFVYVFYPLSKGFPIF